jgi:hypothetical protein
VEQARYETAAMFPDFYGDELGSLHSITSRRRREAILGTTHRHR